MNKRGDLVIRATQYQISAVPELPMDLGSVVARKREICLLRPDTPVVLPIFCTQPQVPDTRR